MSDEHLTHELAELERWYRFFAPPQLRVESSQALKRTVAGALGGLRTDNLEIPRPSEDLKQRIKAAVRQELASRRDDLGARPWFALERLFPWLASAAALVLVAAGYLLLSRNTQHISAPEPMELVSPISPELAGIEAELVSLELRSFATDLLFFGPDDIDSELKEEIERLLAPEFYPNSTDEPNPEGAVQ